jgi:NAD(P)-dependent dehydrogenase (short-subunit alcohol dehydrogenase family)
LDQPPESSNLPPQQLSDQIAVVTGSATGIGRNIATTLAHSGAHVIIADNNQAQGRTTSEQLRSNGFTASFLHCDLAEPDGPSTLINDCISQFGNIDILIHNAKSGKRMGLLEETYESWTETLKVTLNPCFFGSQAAINHWRSTGNKNGRIILIGSIAGALVSHDSPSYQVAKAAVAQLTKYLAVTGSEYGVRVNGVSPGMIVKDEHRERFEQTDNDKYRLAANRVHPNSRVGSGEDVAEAVLFLVSNRSSHINGHMLNLDGGSSVQEQWLVTRNETGL